MKKALVDQLHPVTIPFATLNYQDGFGDHVNKGTTKKLG
jgi:hypothetical protein